MVEPGLSTGGQISFRGTSVIFSKALLTRPCLVLMLTLSTAIYDGIFVVMKLVLEPIFGGVYQICDFSGSVPLDHTA